MEIRPVHLVGALLVSIVLHLAAAYVIYTPGSETMATARAGVTVELGMAAAQVENIAPPPDAELDQPNPAPVATKGAIDATEIPATAEIAIETNSKLSNSEGQFEVIRETPAVEIETEAVGIESAAVVGVAPIAVNIASNPEPNLVEANEVRTDFRPTPATVDTWTEAIALSDPSAQKDTGDPVSDRPGNLDDGTIAAENVDRGGGPGKNSDAAQSYYAELSTWLSRYKQYPRRARRKRQEGVVEVEFTIDRNGRLLDQRIINSSGFRLLDDEAQALLERAAPMPAIPAELEQTRLSIVAPISFSLR